MNSRRLACFEYFANDLQTDIEIDTSTHDDVVELASRQRRAHIVDAPAAKKLDIG